MSKALPTIHTAPEELRDWLEKLVKELQFARLVSAVIALVTRLRDMNTELTKQLANLRRARPRSERMRALEAQLTLPWVVNAKQAEPKSDPQPEGTSSGTSGNRRRTKPSGRNPLPDDLERVPQYNGVPKDLRRCPKCGTQMEKMGHTHCEYLDVIPAKVVVVHRTDEAVKCPLDGAIVAAPPPPRIVEKGVLG